MADSAEPLERSTNPVRVRPLDHSDPIFVGRALIGPYRITREWLEVMLLVDSK